MANIDISAEIAAISSAVYGEEVRGSIKTALQKMVTALNTAIGTQVIDEATVKEVINSEALSLDYSTYTELTEGTDLNAYAGTANNYWIPYTKAQTLNNMPVAQSGRLFVFPAKGSGSTADGGVQIFMTSQNGGKARVYIRGWKGTTWTAWGGIGSAEGIAKSYSESVTYSAGDYVQKDEKVYRRNADAVAPETWTSSNWTEVVIGDEVANAKNLLKETIKQSGIKFSKNLVTGYSISANVGGNVSFIANADRMYYSFKTISPFKVNLLPNSSSYRVAIIVADGAGKCVSNTGWTYRQIVTVPIVGDATVYVLCDFTSTDYVPDAYVESDITKYFTDELSSSAPLWESGSITHTNGNDNNDDKTSIRTIDRLYFPSNIVVNIASQDYRVKLFSYNTDGTYDTSSAWISERGNVSIDNTKRYRLQITTSNSTTIAMRDAINSLHIESITSGSSSSKGLELDLRAIKNGYTGALPLSWESGSITSSGADKNPDDNVIRTPFPAMALAGNLKVFMNDSQYRYRFYYYDSAGTTLVGTSSWYTSPGEIEYTVNTTYKYRIQIATQQAESMEMDEAVGSILFCYSGDTIVDGISPYWVEYIKTKISVINSYLVNGNQKSAFLFLTDTHWNESPDYLNHYGINYALMKHIASKCNIPMLIHGGDLNSEYRSNKSKAREYITIPVSMMHDAFDYVFLTRGNHDDNIEGSNNVWDYVITQSDSYSYMFRGTKDVTFGATGTYFYHDNPHEKLRVISIDCVDFPYTNTVDATKSDLKILAYGYEQLQWLCNVLRDTPANYHIVIFTHAMLAPSVVTREHSSSSPQTRARNYLAVCEILKAYKNRQNFTYSMSGSFVTIHQNYYTGTLSGNFTNSNATIVGVFSGHEHVDCIEEILDSNGNGIGIYNTCTQNSSNMFASSIISSTYQHPMTIGTTTELVWDVVVIDRTAKHVDMIRIGAYAANTDVQAVNVRTFNYT